MHRNVSTFGPSQRYKLDFPRSGETGHYGDGMKVYLFGWPGSLGGASTKFVHLVWLLHRRYPITVVTPRTSQLTETHWTRWMEQNGIRYCAIGGMPARLQGWGVSLCDSEFVGSPEWVEMRRRGLKMAWGNEMMWPLPRETGAVIFGQVDAILYVSPVQRATLEPEYQRMLRGTLHRRPISAGGRRTSGWIEGRTKRERLRWIMVGNYIDPGAFPFRDRSSDFKPQITVGRLSRPDPSKFPVDFPQSYEKLGLKEPRFRVMGWSAELQARWSNHCFDDRWELLEPFADPVPFLQSLDLFMYEVGPRCRESWGRSVVEAMLTGAIPLVPKGGGHHLENLIEHRRSGFLCRDRGEFGQYARYLQDHPAERFRISQLCRQIAVRRLCNTQHHLRLWNKVFHGC